MTQGFLNNETDGSRLPIGTSLVVGRNPDCGLVLSDPSASRRHLEIVTDKGRFLWRDLGSSNGTLLNGQPARGGELKPQDLLTIGEVRLRFDQVESAPTPKPKLRDDSRRFQNTILDPATNAGDAPEAATTAERSTALLEAIYSIANEIATNYDSCTLMDSILQTTMEAIDAQRGAIFLSSESSLLGECPACGKVHRIVEGKLQPAELGEIPISNTVVSRVLQQGESVLYKDAVSDSELDAAVSILTLNLRSILCAPLRAKHGILGLLYIDSNRPDKLYSQEDLLLVAAVGNSAGIALENARMHQEILEKQRIEQEIATAWTIQEGFLVKDWPAKDARFLVYGETRPAKTVGGDFYDYVQPDPDVLGILIGDVSGKGVPAALTMAQLIAQFRLYARECRSPAEVLRKLNTDLAAQSRRGLFCSMCYLMIHLPTGRVLAANAGHLPALRVAIAGASFFAHASGPPLGILPTGPWEDEKLELNPGESVLLYTDGIIEARGSVTITTPGAQPPEYGDEGLYWICNEMAGHPPKRLLDAVNENVGKFCAPLLPHDDCTMIAVRYAGHGR